MLKMDDAYPLDWNTILNQFQIYLADKIEEFYKQILELDLKIVKESVDSLIYFSNIYQFACC